jgi:hypothetical protein
MKVVVFFQFYLPYILPRTNDWFEGGHRLVEFTHNNHKVVVHPRKPDEALFLNEIDQELSLQTMTVDPPDIPVKDMPTSVSVKDLCYDRIEVLVFGEINSVDDVHQEEIRREYLISACQGCNQFLFHCSVVARDPDITGLVWYFNFEDRTYYFERPYTVIWCREENGEPVARLRDSQGELLEGRSWAIASPKRRPVSIDAVAQSLSQSRQPNLPLSLVVQAKNLIAVDRLHEGIIDLGSALEIASKQYVYRKGKDTDPQANIIVRTRASFAERRYHRLTSYIDNRSLKIEDINTFDLVEKIYRTRNNLAHDGELAYTERSGAIIPVDYILAHRFWDACERAVDWLASL